MHWPLGRKVGDLPSSLEEWQGWNWATFTVGNGIHDLFVFRTTLSLNIRDTVFTWVGKQNHGRALTLNYA